MDESKVKGFDAAHHEKLKHLSKEERAKAGLKKSAQELEVSRDCVSEPKGLASGATDENGKMSIDLEERYADEQ